jgi:tight adherence protein C
MSNDQVILLIGVDGFVLAVLLVMVALLFPAKDTGISVGTGEPVASSRERLVFPLLDGLQKLGVRFSPAGASAKMQLRLDIAGNPRGWFVERVFAVKGLALILFGIFGLVIGGGPLKLQGLGLAAGLGLAGFFVPDVLLYNGGLKRQQKIQKAVPDTVDLLSVSMKAGLGFDGAVGRVAQSGEGPLAAELGRYLQELRLGKSRREALQALSERSTVVDLHHIVSALAQADQLGIPVAKVLEQQAKEMRVKRRQRSEERAQKVTIKIIMPTLFCIFPCLFIAIIGPGVIRIVQAFSGGIGS